MFPKFIPPLETDITRDESGLTEPEKIALTSGWNFFKNDLIFHLNNISILFFEKHPEYLIAFEKDPPDNQSMHQHSQKTITIFSLLIEKGLKDKSLFDTIINGAVIRHQKFGISKIDMEKMAIVITDYLKVALERQSTPTFDSAVIAFFHNICDAFERIVDV